MSSFFANTTKLLGGNMAAQIIGVVSIPVITRLYGAEAFGMFAIVLSLATIFSPVFTLSLHMSILVAKTDEESSESAFYALVISSMFFAVSFGFIYFYKSDVVTLLGLGEAPNIVFFIPLLALCQALYLVASYVSLRDKKYSAVAVGKVIDSVVDRGGAVSAGVYIGGEAIWLLLTKLLGLLTSLLLLLKYCSGVSVRGIRGLGNEKYRGYIVYNTPSMLIISGMLQLPVIILGALYSPAIAGVFAIANRIVGIPVQVLGNALSKTVTQHISEKWNKGDLEGVKRDASALYEAILMLLVVPFGVMALLGAIIIPLLLGDGWSDAGKVVQWLSVLSLTSLMAQAFGGIFDITGSQNMRLYYQSCNFIVRMGAILAGAMAGIGFINVIAIYAMVSTLMNVVAMILLFSRIGSSSALLSKAINPVIIIITFVLMAVFGTELDSDPVYSLLVLMFAGAVFVLASRRSLSLLKLQH